MRISSLLTPVVAVLLSTALAGPALAGGKAPDFSVRDVDGRTVSLSDHSDKVVVISFWATWCTPCKAEMPHLQAMYDQYKDQGFVVLSVSVDEARNEPQVKAMARAGSYTFPVLLDQDASVVTLYNPRKSVPFSVVIDRDGNIHTTHEGYSPGDEAKLKAEVEALLGVGDAPDTASTSTGGE